MVAVEESYIGTARSSGTLAALFVGAFMPCTAQARPDGICRSDGLGAAIDGMLVPAVSIKIYWLPAIRRSGRSLTSPKSEQVVDGAIDGADTNQINGRKREPIPRR